MVEVELGDELVRQVELTGGALPEGTDGKPLKFDAKGTLHMMCRDAEGKLLKDVPVVETNYKRSYKDEVLSDYKEEHERLERMTRKSNLILASGVFLLLLLTLLSITIIGRL